MNADTMDKAMSLVDTAIGSAMLLESMATNDETGAALGIIATALEDAAHELRDELQA